MAGDDAHAFWLRTPGRGEIRSVTLPEPSMRPSGSLLSSASSVESAITTPMNSTPSRISRSMIGSPGARGGRAMTLSVARSTPSASAGAASVSKLIHSTCVASSGATMPPSDARSPNRVCPTTPRKTVSTSPMFEDSR